MDLMKRLSIAIAIFSLIAAALAFTNTFVTREAMAEEIQQVYLKMDLRDLDRRKDELADREMELQIMMIKQPDAVDAIQHQLNKVEGEQERVKEQIRDLLQGDQ